MQVPLRSGQPDAHDNWFDTPSGQRLVLEELREVIPLLTAHIGVRGLYLRPGATAPATLSGNMLQSVLSLHRDREGFAGELCCACDALPIENDSICLTYALHALDHCPRPQALLDEVRRTLRPDGVLFLIGLSPGSAWRLRWRGRGLQPRSAQRSRALLSAAGLNVELQIGLGPIWPRLGERAPLPISERTGASALDPLRAGYLLVARKRRLPLTPIGPRKRAAVGLQPQVRPG
jgi:SAM-dependent methyltransferase